MIKDLEEKAKQAIDEWDVNLALKVLDEIEAELDPKETLFKIESIDGTRVDIPSVKILGFRKPSISTRMTDDQLNDAIAGLPQQEKVAFLQSLFGEDWQEHYQGGE